MITPINVTPQPALRPLGSCRGCPVGDDDGAACQTDGSCDRIQFKLTPHGE
jgi:hypothetical protein